MLKKRQSKTVAIGLYQRQIIANLPGIGSGFSAIGNILYRSFQNNIEHVAVSGINLCLPQQDFENLVLYTDDLRSSPVHLTAAMSPVAMESN